MGEGRTCTWGDPAAPFWVSVPVTPPWFTVRGVVKEKCDNLPSGPGLAPESTVLCPGTTCSCVGVLNWTLDAVRLYEAVNASLKCSC